MMTAALLVLADLRAVRTGLRGVLFARFFTVVFIVGPPTEELLRTYFTAKGILVCEPCHRYLTVFFLHQFTHIMIERHDPATSVGINFVPMSGPQRFQTDTRCTHRRHIGG